MIVNFEFLGSEAIENIITCLNFKMDKVVFFGYSDVIQEQSKSVEKFLKKYCGVQKILFHALPKNDLPKIYYVMRKEIEHELSQKNSIYFDITGGESIILVAFGMLAKEYKTPIHIYNIPENCLIEFDEDKNMMISKNVTKQKVFMNLDRYIELKGGLINYNLHKEGKSDKELLFAEEVTCIWQVAKKHWDIWNPFSDFLRYHMIPEKDLTVLIDKKKITDALDKSVSKLKTINQLNEIIDELAAVGALRNVEYNRDKYKFSFKNQFIKACLWEGGRILELHTFLEEKKDSDDCKVGIHLDWDGVIHPQVRVDVLNEVDVLSLSGNIPTFISCKSGKMGGQQTLHALYELETVTKRFGGKYAKKVLVSMQNISDVYLRRAKEMDIDVRMENL